LGRQERAIANGRGIDGDFGVTRRGKRQVVAGAAARGARKAFELLLLLSRAVSSSHASAKQEGTIFIFKNKLIELPGLVQYRSEPHQAGVPHPTRQFSPSGRKSLPRARSAPYRRSDPAAHYNGAASKEGA